MIGTIQASSDTANQPRANARGVVMGEVERTRGTPEELKDGALPRLEVEQFLYECKIQPAWRREADKCADYYDNNQLDADTVQKLNDRNQPPLIDNLVKPTIDTVLGMEAKSRTDWVVRPEDDDIANDDTADALSVKLKHAETESRADRACSDAYAGQCKAGVHWVEVGRETDALKYPYRVRAIHRREIFWDWKAEQPDLSDAKYLIRRRWLELDAAIAMMPQYADLFRNTVSGWAGFDPMVMQDTGLVQSWEIERDTKLEFNDWRDTDRQRVCLYEIWYRRWVRGYVMTTPSGQTIEVDFDNPRHVEAINAGVVNIRMATFTKVRMAWYCGPHFLYDIPSPYKHGFFPYAPFFGFREDLTGVPYGLIRTMISPQDEVNARKSKMLWQLNSRRVTTDSDAVKDHAKTAEEVSRPDAYVILDANRKPGSEFKVESGGDLAAQQFQAMVESKQAISEVSGIHKTLQGQQTGARSGYAINSLVEQGINTLGELNDNYRFSRRMVGEMLFSMVQEDLNGKPTKVTIGKGRSKRVVVLNMPVVDPETGQITIQNNTAKVRAKVVLDDMPASPTFQMQQFMTMGELARSLPPQAQAVMVPYILESSGVPNAIQAAEQLRKTMNIPDDSPEAMQAQEQAAQRQQAIENQALALEFAEKQAKIEQMRAKAAKDMADARSSGAGDGALAQMQAEYQAVIDRMQLQIDGLKQRLADRSAEAVMKDQTDRFKARLSSATSIETAMIAHPQTDLAPVLAELQKLAEQVSNLSSKEPKG